MSTTKLFIAERFKKDKDDIRIIRTYGARRANEILLFKGVPADWDLSNFEFTDSLAEADFVLVPQAVKKISPQWHTYFETIYANARSAGKRLILFIGGDLGNRVHVDREGVAVFKGSDYVHNMTKNEIIMPGYAEDLGKLYDSPIQKKGEKPVVSFCGYAGFPSLKTHLRYLVKNAYLDARSIFGDPHSLVLKRGIYFRRKALAQLAASSRIDTNFLIRSTFSGNVASAAKDPAVLRREYIDNILNSDFVLAPKGDGNYSVRFYEALSLGRIPLLIDTDMRLPLEGVIDYSAFILRVPHTELYRLGDIVADFYEKLTDEKFAAMQLRAKEVFQTHLRYDKYFNTVFPILKERGIAAIR